MGHAGFCPSAVGLFGALSVAGSRSLGGQGLTFPLHRPGLMLSSVVL